MRNIANKRRKYVIRFRKREHNKIKRKILIVFVSMFLFSMLISSLTSSAKADDDEYVYSNLFSNNEITYLDPLGIMKQEGSTSNNYRYLFYNTLYATRIINQQQIKNVLHFYSENKALYNFNQYYLDFQNNKSFESTTREYSEALFVPESEDIQYESGNSIQNGSLDYPETYYNATFSFDEDLGEDIDLISGTSVPELDFIDYFTTNGHQNNKATILNELDNHYSVLNYSCNTIAGKYSYIAQYLSTQSIDIIEFWFSYVDCGSEFYQISLQNSTYSVCISFSISELSNRFSAFYLGGSVYRTCLPNTWYHVKIIYDCSTKKYSCYYNNELIVNNQPFLKDCNNNKLINFLMYTYSVAESTHREVYFDAWGSTALDSQYIEGENYYPFTNSTYLESGITKIESEYIQPNEYAINPNSDVDVNWQRQPASGTHYTKVNDYPSTTTTFIFAVDGDELKTEQFGLSDVSIDKNITKIVLNVYGISVAGSDDTKVNLYDGSNLLGEKTVSFGTSISLQEVEWIVNLDQDKLDSLEVKFTAPTNLIGSNPLCIYSFRIYATDDNNPNYIESTINVQMPYLTSNQHNVLDYVLINLKSNVSVNGFALSIYNYDLEVYEIISAAITTSFVFHNFTYNNDYIDNEQILIKIESFSNTSYCILLDCIINSIQYFEPIVNDDGYHRIYMLFLLLDEYDVSDAYIYTYIDFYKDCLNITLRETKISYDDYLHYNKKTIFYNNSVNAINFDFHVRYGYNLGGTVKTVNIMYEITLFHEFNTSYISLSNEIHYTPSVKTYQQLTIQPGAYYNAFNNQELSYYQIFSNYSYNSLYGLRSLQGLTLNEYNSFLSVPNFLEGISLIQPTYQESDSVEIVGEPSPPAGASKYWTYSTFRPIEEETLHIDIGNWSIDYTRIIPEEYTAKFYYTEKIVKESAWGNWRIGTDTWNINLNGIRDAWNWFVNLLLLMLQFFLYLLVAGLSFILMFIGCWILTFIFNIVLYYIFIALIWVLWYVYLGLYWLLYYIWQGLVWVYENLVVPFGRWLYQVFLPLCIEAFIVVWAFLLTCLIYLISLGQIDFWDTYDTIYTLLHTIADFLLTNMVIVMKDLPALFIAIALYLLLICLTYIRYLYAKARGYKERAEALYSALMVYLTPITYTYAVIRKIYESIPTAGGGGGQSE